MRESELIGEAPDYLIFYEDDENVQISPESDKFRNEFFSITIASNLVMGPVFYIVSKNVHLVCIPCKNGDTFVDLSNVDLYSIRKTWQTVYSNLQQVYITMEWELEKITLAHTLKCDGFVGDNQFVTDEDTEFSIEDLCVHQILSQKLNYTIANNGKIRLPHGVANGLTFISTIGLNFKRIERWQWLTHGTQYFPLNILTILERPGFRGTVLLKPFHFATWVTLVMCVLV